MAAQLSITPPSVAANACLSEPLGVKATADGSVYFTDFVLHQIFRVTAAAEPRSLLGPSFPARRSRRLTSGGTAAQGRNAAVGSRQ